MPLPTHQAEFSAFYREHFAFVWRTLRRFGLRELSLEDAAQDVFLVAHRRAGSWDSWSSPRAWLFGVARRIAANHRRTRVRHARRIAAVQDHPASPCAGACPDQQIDDRAQLAALSEAIASLPAGRRHIYILTELEGLSAPEIAEALEIKLNTVYSRLRRARREVATQLRRAGFQIGGGTSPGSNLAPQARGQS